MALARSRVPDDRRRLLMGIADLCEGSAEEIRAAQGIVSDVFLTLVRNGKAVPVQKTRTKRRSRVRNCKVTVCTNPMMGSGKGT